MVTVLMSVYNPPLRWLEHAVHSILCQTHRDFEFLILDDGSTDPERAAPLLQCDTRIRYVREPHRGLTATLNRGLELARHPLIARQDADDWSGRQRLARQLAWFESNPQGILCGSDAWTHQEDGRMLWRTHLPRTRTEILGALARGNPFVHGSTMYRRDAALDAGGYRETFRCSQDYDLFWRMAERGEAENLPDPLYHYRYAAGSVSAAKAGDQLAAHRAIQALAAARASGHTEDAAAALAEAVEHVREGAGLHRSLLKQADHLMLAGHYGAALRAYVQLAARHPANPLAWGKLARLGVFRTAPFLREACFR